MPGCSDVWVFVQNRPNFFCNQLKKQKNIHLDPLPRHKVMNDPTKKTTLEIYTLYTLILENFILVSDSLYLVWDVFLNLI